MDGQDLSPEEQEALAEIRKKKSLLIQQHRMKKSTAESRPVVPRKFDTDRKFTTERMGWQLSSLGLDPSLAIIVLVASQEAGKGSDQLIGETVMMEMLWI